MNFKSGYFKWVIKFLDYTLYEDGDQLLGITLNDDKVVKIGNIENKQVERETVLHELLHVCFEDSVIISDDKQEEVIRHISPRLMDILSQQHIRDYLFSKKGEE